jgi:hypothetical protein
MNNLSLLGSKYLHALLYIVADQPSNKNLSPSVPLVGTDSYKRLLIWLGAMNVDITRVRFYNQTDGPFDNPISKATLNKAVELGQIKVIALGNKAAQYLNKAGVDEYFVLPHPSSRNRLLNDTILVKEKLGACKNYIYGQIKKESTETVCPVISTSEQSNSQRQTVFSQTDKEGS